MKPGDHPDFFRRNAPEGASRESSLRLDSSGVFWHEGARVDHPALAAALHRWIARHPDDGRYILSNGYDWVYFEVEDAPFTVRSVRLAPRALLLLSDGTEEDLRAENLSVGAGDALYASVKGGVFAAKFTPHAQLALAPLLVEGPNLEPMLEVDGVRRGLGRD